MKTAGPHSCSAPRRCDFFRPFVLLLVSAALLFSAGCATVGRDFPADRVEKIRIGTTTKDEIRVMFGDPWRVGLEDGLETWSYGKYKYKMFSEKDAKDLVVRFRADNVVESYSFNTTNPDL